MEYVQPKVTFSDNTSGYYRWNESDYVLEADAAYNKAINDKWLIGIGLTVDLNKTKAGTKTESYGPVATSLKHHYSIYLQPTYVIDDASAVFAKIGYHTIRVEAIGQPAYWIDDKLNTEGVGYGIGYKRFFSKNFFAQGELQFVDYHTKSFVDGTYRWEYQQKTAAGIISVGYKF